MERCGTDGALFGCSDRKTFGKFADIPWLDDSHRMQNSQSGKKQGTDVKERENCSVAEQYEQRVVNDFSGRNTMKYATTPIKAEKYRGFLPYK